MKYISLVSACVCLSLFSIAQAKAPKGDGWVSLFNGEDLRGWESRNGFAHYTVEDGAIVGRTQLGSPNTFLTTLEHYGDFELVFEVKVDEGLNSGVQIRSHSREWGRTRYHGPQVEIESSPGQGGFIYGEGLMKGWLSPEPSMQDRDRAAHNHFKNGEWNKYRIIAKGPVIETFINGEQITKFEDGGLHRTYPHGSIGLQVHSVPRDKSYEVRWRNLYIREL